MDSLYLLFPVISSTIYYTIRKFNSDILRPLYTTRDDDSAFRTIFQICSFRAWRASNYTPVSSLSPGHGIHRTEVSSSTNWKSGVGSGRPSRGE